MHVKREGKGKQIAVVAVVLGVLVGIVAIFVLQHRAYRRPVSGAIFGSSLERQTGASIHVVDVATATQANLRTPKTESVWAADSYLQDDGWGLDVVVGDVHRFYPYQVLAWHPVLNDVLEDRPLLIAYCAFCEGGNVYERPGEESFEHVDEVWNHATLVQDERTRSRWSVVSGEAVGGDRFGESLRAYPATVMRWREWKRTYQSGDVLARVDGGVDYASHPYRDFLFSPTDTLFSVDRLDSRLPAKEEVLGVRVGGQQKAYALSALREQGLVQQPLGNDSVVLWWDDSYGAVRVFSANFRGERLTFSLKRGELVDDQTGSVWNNEGEAVSGDLVGETLKQLPFQRLFWFVWAAVYPETDNYQF